MNSEEKRAYQRGYAAGKRRKVREIRAEARMREDRAFLDRAFLAALPAAITAQGWKRGEQPITALKDRVLLAVDFAREALKAMQFERDEQRMNFVLAEAKAEQNARDAERLDWLLKLWPLEIVRLVHSRHTHGATSSEPRAAIDAAIAAGEASS